MENLSKLEKIRNNFTITEAEASNFFTLGNLGTLGGSTFAVKLIWSVMRSLDSSLTFNLIPLLISFIVVCLLGVLLRPKTEKIPEVAFVSIINSLIIYETVIGIGLSI